MERLVDTCFGAFRVENGKAVYVDDERLYYNIPDGMADEDLQYYIEDMIDDHDDFDFIEK